MAAAVKFDDGTGSFVNNCFPVRSIIRYTENGACVWKQMLKMLADVYEPTFLRIYYFSFMLCFCITNFWLLLTVTYQPVHKENNNNEFSYFFIWRLANYCTNFIFSNMAIFCHDDVNAHVVYLQYSIPLTTYALLHYYFSKERYIVDQLLISENISDNI